MRLTFAVLAALLCSCTSIQPHPTPSRPIVGCHISCVNVMGAGHAEQHRPFFKRQHGCTPGMTRHFEDVRITGEYKKSEEEWWITAQGDYPKADVELQTCDSMIHAIQSQMDAGQLGRHPGEDDLGRPIHR